MNGSENELTHNGRKAPFVFFCETTDLTGRDSLHLNWGWTCQEKSFKRVCLCEAANLQPFAAYNFSHKMKPYFLYLLCLIFVIYNIFLALPKGLCKLFAFTSLGVFQKLYPTVRSGCLAPLTLRQHNVLRRV